jgi:endonuclease G, mitochondrial
LCHNNGYKLKGVKVKFKATLLLSTLFSVLLSAASTQCGGIYLNNQAPDILNQNLTPKTKELCYSFFAVTHSAQTRTPLWSAEHLTRVSLQSKIERADDFHPEERLSHDARAELEDYSGTGMDRGHLSPAADMPSAQAMHESFALSNMIPQNSTNNRGIWSAIEGATRHLANTQGGLYVITGPLFTGDTLQRLKGRVMIPTQIYKAIYDPSTGQGAAYLTNNSAGNDYKVVSIAQIEKLSGIKLFPTMSATAKQTAMSLPAPRMYDRTQTANLVSSSGQPQRVQQERGSVVPPIFSHPIVAKTALQCGTKTMCRQMVDCAEAKFYLNECGESKLDGNGDGVPCEKLCR